MKKIISFGALSGLLPFVAFAATSTRVENVLNTISQILTRYVIPLLITIAVIYFIWGVIQYTVSSDEEAKKGARDKIIKGLIGLFIIIAFWGIIFTVSNTLDIGSTQLKPTELPCIPNPAAGILC
jgi:formate hydrogenlyase subunit 3/multisubunit Na+/H+ antiporter MnhD subunit